MSLRNLNFYFETSAVNYLADSMSWADALATKGLQSTKGNLWYISPVTLWEILLTSDADRRERIIFLCQHLFHEKLINPPSEFIINYIKSGCPIIEKPYDFHSKLEINEVWEDICKDKRRTFVLDFKELKSKMKLFQDFSKQLDKIINRVVFDLEIRDEAHAYQNTINIIYNQINKNFKFQDDVYQKIVKISILLALFILCIEGDIDNLPIKIWWNKIGIVPILDRLFYLVDNHSEIFYRGPINQMAFMAYHQISLGQKSNRGLFMDCLHSIYTTYANIFITNDEHFKTLKEKEIHPNFSRVMHTSEINILTYERKVIRPNH